MKGVPLNEDLYNYIVLTFAEEDDILKHVVKHAEEMKFPLIQISPELGKFLFMLIKIIKAKRVLEIGTLTGYSTIWMARALQDDGKVTTLEISKEHAGEAISNFKMAGLDNKIELILGKAMNSLNNLNDEKFDFVFIDADKTGYPEYYDKVIGMMNKGGIIAADNTLRKGEIVTNLNDEAVKATRILNEKMANDSRVESLLIPISDGLTIAWVK
jgi:predicted O-methyltransferase YrrM